MSGKSLIFIDYLPVKAGDWVYTDGRVIFGNVPPRGSPAVFSDEPSDILVLDNGELRGYFTKNGTFKKYNVAQDDWIVNSDKKFAHGAEFIDEVHYGYYTRESTTIYAPMNFGRIAVVLPEDDFSDLESFKYKDWYGQYRHFYILTGSRASCSYEICQAYKNPRHCP